MKTLLLLLSVLYLLSCTQRPTEGPDAHGYSWVKTRDSIPANLRVIEIVKNGNIYLKCGQLQEAGGCSIIGKDGPDFKPDGKCYIFLPAGYAKWMEDHENKHCDGWDHPGSKLNWSPGDQHN